MSIGLKRRIYQLNKGIWCAYLGEVINDPSFSTILQHWQATIMGPVSVAASHLTVHEPMNQADLHQLQTLVWLSVRWWCLFPIHSLPNRLSIQATQSMYSLLLLRRSLLEVLENNWGYALRCENPSRRGACSVLTWHWRCPLQPVPRSTLQHESIIQISTAMAPFVWISWETSGHQHWPYQKAGTWH